VDGCGTHAYVVVRKDQKVVEITGVDGTPALGSAVSVGSEPTGLALTPNGTRLYVTNWVDGTVSVVDPGTMTVTSTIDLNTTLAATGFLGTVTARAALAHPRGVAITNNGDNSDADEHIYVTEWFAQRTAPEAANGSNSDVNKQGLIYNIDATGTAAVIALPPVADTGFNNHNNVATGCFPNPGGSITLKGNFAYVTSTCASPVGPLGVFQKGACTATSACTGPFGALSTCTNGVCTNSCTTDADCGFGAAAGACTGAGAVPPAGVCAPNAQDTKSTTHPAVSIVNLSSGVATTVNLDKNFNDITAGRFPLLPTDIAFFNNFGYLSSEGSDAVYRLVTDTTTGAITAVGALNNKSRLSGTSGTQP
jgi:YVTN family beta-propeller protein